MKKLLLLLLFCVAVAMPAKAQETAKKKTLQEQMWEFAGYDLRSKMCIYCEEDKRPLKDNSSYGNEVYGYEFSSEMIDSDHLSDYAYCHSPFYGYVDDTKNGYLFIVDGDPLSCDCRHITIVGAYRKANGNHVLIGCHTGSCPASEASKSFLCPYPQGFQMFTNENFETILPPEINVELFKRRGYIDIPRNGPETVLYFKQRLLDLDTDIQVEILIATLQELNLKEVDLANQENRSRIIGMMVQKIEEDYSSSDWDKDSVYKLLAYLYAEYIESTTMTIRSVVMGWNKEVGRFYIKRINEQPKRYQNFLDFLENTPRNSFNRTQ